MEGRSIAELMDSLEYGPAPEDESPLRDWQARLPADKHWINGKWTASRDKRGAYERRDPASGNVLTTCAQAGQTDVNAAIRAASKAQATWQAMGGPGRARHLYALARMVQRHSRLFALADSFDSGKPIRETRDIDIPLVARHFYHHAGWAQLLEREFPDTKPWGVVGQVIPWNFPLLMLAWKVAPALAAGNTVVLKPAEDTSLGARAFAELASQAGLPPGVLNVVTGDGETGRLIVEHEDIDKVAFTGSTEVGKAIRRATAGTGKGLTLELGGKSPFIVFEDADLDSAVEGVVDAIWFNQGEVCCAGSRLLVQESVQGRLLDKLKARMETLRIGDPRDKAIDMGMLISPAHRAKVAGMVDEAVSVGAAC
ncbi:MAG: aldehyde dehydrogenase family protein, partial [Pseudomonadota bacterium]